MNYIWKTYASDESITSITLTQQKHCSLILIPLESSDTKDSVENNNLLSTPKCLEEFSPCQYPNDNENKPDMEVKQPKKGRYKKNEVVFPKLAFHSKLYQDNIKRKIKTHFHNFLITFINNEIKKEWKIQKYKLRKMDSKITQNITIAYNKKLLETPVKDILSKVSMKFRDQSTNQNFIEKIVKSKPYLSELLNSTYEYIFMNFYLKSSSEMFKGSSKDESFEKHLNKIKLKDGIEYQDRYYENAMQFVDFFKHCKERCRKNKSMRKES